MGIYLNKKEKNLKSIIFNNSDIGKYDEIIIISGYLGIETLKELSEIKVPATVVFGMYLGEGVEKRIHNLYKNYADKNVNVLYSDKQEVHSKIYLWKEEGRIVKAMVGSANFSSTGLTSLNREILVDVNPSDYEDLEKYVKSIISNSVSAKNVSDAELKSRSTYQRKKELDQISLVNQNSVCILSLVGTNGQIQDAAGLNWGQAAKGHVKRNDAYIPIRVKNIKGFPEIFEEKLMSSDESRGKKSNRQNNPIDVVFDDETVMACLFEGSQTVNNKIYPNKLASFPEKEILGKYFRSRLGVGDGKKINTEDLTNYGRTDIYLEKLGTDLYFIDFSPQ